MLRNEVFDDKFNRLDILEKFTYCQYVESLRGTGTFTLKCPITKKNVSILKNDNIIWFEEDVAGVIQNVNIDEDESAQGNMTINGCLMNVLYDWRYVYPVFNYTGTVAGLMNGIVTESCISNSDAKRNYDSLEVIENPTSLPIITKQKTGGSVLELLTEVGEAYACGFKTGFYPKEKRFKFQVIEGVNRSVHNTEGNKRVIFSESLNNVLQTTYVNDISDYRNITLVAGEATVGSRSFVTVVDGNEQSGFYRRELYTDARDLQTETYDEDGNEIVLTEEEYQAALTNRGHESLSECAKKIYMESEVRHDSLSSYKYREDYNLGDIVTCIRESLDIMIDVQVTEVTVTQDANGYSVVPTLGEGQPTLYSILKKKGVVR